MPKQKTYLIKVDEIMWNKFKTFIPKNDSINTEINRLIKHFVENAGEYSEEFCQDDLVNIHSAINNLSERFVTIEAKLNNGFSRSVIPHISQERPQLLGQNMPTPELRKYAESRQIKNHEDLSREQLLEKLNE